MLPHWRLILRDLLTEYRVDLYDPALRTRPGSWLRNLIGGLLDVDSRLQRELTPTSGSR